MPDFVEIRGGAHFLCGVDMECLSLIDFVFAVSMH